MTSLPIYFVSHGAPDIVLRDTPASSFFRNFGAELRGAKAILIISAHWMTDEPMITASEKPETIHDFGGFPKALYEMRYPAMGDAKLAAKIRGLLAPNFPSASMDNSRGLDHGAWIPLLLALPDAEIPVLQLSIQPYKDAAHHYEMGKALRSIRDEGVIIMASGSATHNLRAAFAAKDNSQATQVTRFNDWLYENLSKRNDAELLNWQNAPEAKWNHPTPDHFLPLFVALGASKNASAERIHQSFDYSVLSMDCYRL